MKKIWWIQAYILNWLNDRKMYKLEFNQITQNETATSQLNKNI